MCLAISVCLSCWEYPHLCCLLYFSYRTKKCGVLLQTKDVIFNSYLPTSHAPTQTVVTCRGRCRGRGVSGVGSISPDRICQWPPHHTLFKPLSGSFCANKLDRWRVVIAWVMARHLSSWPWLSGSPYIPAPQPTHPPHGHPSLPPRFTHLGTCSLAPEPTRSRSGGRAGGRARAHSKSKVAIIMQESCSLGRPPQTPSWGRAVIAVDLQSDRLLRWLRTLPRFVSTFVSRHTNDINQYCSGNFLPLPYADEPPVWWPGIWVSVHRTAPHRGGSGGGG